jgi:GNAT superfamily N-acetyltransferase
MQTYGPFMYVAFLSTRPEHQGKGLGGQLLEHLTQKADAVGKWCYLEATNERNARLYERYRSHPASLCHTCSQT